MPQKNLWCMIIRVWQQSGEKSQVGLRLSQVCLQQDYCHGSWERLTREDGLLLLLSGHCEGAQVVLEITVSKTDLEIDMDEYIQKWIATNQAEFLKIT